MTSAKNESELHDVFDRPNEFVYPSRAEEVSKQEPAVGYQDSTGNDRGCSLRAAIRRFYYFFARTVEASLDLVIVIH
jgi:hypothetical protein